MQSVGPVYRGIYKWGFDDEDILSDIQEEFEDLYVRAIRRIRRASVTNLSKTATKTYSMFQIAICAHKHFSLVNISMAALQFAIDEPALLEIRNLSYKQPERRLNSRSRGLFEVDDLSKGDTNRKFNSAIYSSHRETLHAR